jgi:hypothetical protein
VAERSQSSQRSPRPAVGRTRSAQNSATSGPAVPVPQVTDSQASSGAESARAMADSGPGPSVTVNVASPRMATP